MSGEIHSRFVTTATGEVHCRMAAAMAASFRRWGWPGLTVVSDRPVKADRNIIADADDIGSGRGLKTRFADFLDKGEGMVCFIDADCEATGAFPGFVPLPPKTVAGIVIGVLDPKMPAEHRAPLEASGLHLHLASTVLLCSDLETARGVCARWHPLLKQRGFLGDDEVTLNTSMGFHFRRADTGGNLLTPFRNLKHHAAGGGQTVVDTGLER